MLPYYNCDGITIYHGDACEVIPTLPADGVVISDPPYNIGYDYESYQDSLLAAHYQHLLEVTFRSPSVMLHYPESLIEYCRYIKETPTKCVSWIYHANTSRQWRMIAWFGCKPDFALMRQKYKNPEDRRIRELIAQGSKGASLYDWWNIQQVKNVSEEKYDHPCQIPVEVMGNIIGITPANIIIDPFMGSGTTLVAAKMQHRNAIGIEIEKKYCEIAVERLRVDYFDFREMEER